MIYHITNICIYIYYEGKMENEIAKRKILYWEKKRSILRGKRIITNLHNNIKGERGINKLKFFSLNIKT